MTSVVEPGRPPLSVDARSESRPTRRVDRTNWDDRSSTEKGTAEVRPPVVDDRKVVAEKLARILATGENIDVVAIATAATQALEDTLRHEPHVVVMDYRLRDADGPAEPTEVRPRPAATTILIVIGSDQPDVLDAGIVEAEGGTALDRLVGTVRSVNQANAGLSRLTPDGGRGRDHVDALTRRQAEILGIMAGGLSDQAIADRLTLSLNTVRTHVQTILRKLGAHSKLEAVAVATRRHLLAR